MSVISVTNLTAGYGGLPVVRNLNLRVESGEVVALLGPNGAGKTTTLLTIGGVLPAISGSIECRASRRSGSPYTESLVVDLRSCLPTGESSSN